MKMKNYNLILNYETKYNNHKKNMKNRFFNLIKKLKN